MRLLTRPNLGGPTRQAIALWHAQRQLGVRTLLVTGRVDAGEALLSPADEGVPPLSWQACLEAGPAAEGWVELPHLGRGIAPVADRRAGQHLLQLLRAHRPDVVHTHTTKAGAVGRRAAFRAGVPVVAHTFHGHVLQDYFGGLLSRWLQHLERTLARQSDLLIAVSHSCADELAAAGVAAREKFLVVPPAVAVPQPIRREQARARLGIPASQWSVVAVGRLVPIKRIEHFVRMVAALPDCRGDVFGDGPDRTALAALVARLAPERVRLCGHEPAIASLLPGYDALVLSSIREGCPLVAVEAFAARVPVSGYDVPGVHDVLAEGRGVLVPVAAGPAGLAAGLQRLYGNPALAAACVESGLAMVGRFAPGAVAEQLLDAYCRALSEKSRYHGVRSG
ncbi:MAG TPA: glycosyltransferase family 4 protein [Planctomycetota bacterium]|nr:glycosyltransferase family 4 protein [Planctomycetota bacterium]